MTGKRNEKEKILMREILEQVYSEMLDERNTENNIEEEKFLLEKYQNKYIVWKC